MNCKDCTNEQCEILRMINILEKQFAEIMVNKIVDMICYEVGECNCWEGIIWSK